MEEVIMIREATDDWRRDSALPGQGLRQIGEVLPGVLARYGIVLARKDEDPNPARTPAFSIRPAAPGASVKPF